ncbi:type VI secretion system lipoprotein TssJ [Enterobacteriaceae bacterium 4M9]|nr:type VI secretion system lipoprotein TssJ [Enterobacteriaceae bacterium 4M9]
MLTRYRSAFSPVVHIAFITAIFLLLTGCHYSAPAQEIKKYNLSIGATSKANNSTPLKVRVLLLRSDAEFMSADFDSLQNRNQETLGASLIKSSEFFLTPQQLTKHLPNQTYSDARYIGIIAEYQNINEKKWRIALPLSAQSEEKAFNRFWKWFDSEKQAHIFIDENGIRPLSDTLRHSTI